MLWLEFVGETLGQASLDPKCAMITDFTIDHLTLGLSHDWLDIADAAIAPGNQRNH